MCITSNYLNMNSMGNCVGGYQYGMGIADLFTGVPGLNTVWNFNNYGNFNNCGCSCGGPNWRVMAGFTSAKILGTICMNWIGSARAEKAQKQAEEKAKAKQYNKDLNNAVTMINPTSGSTVITIDDVKNVRSYNKEELLRKVSDMTYDDKKLKAAETKVTGLNEKIEGFKNDLENIEKELSTATADSNTSEDTIKNIKARITAQEGLIAAKQTELDAAQEEVEKYKAEETAFNKAKDTVREAINKYAGINDAKDAETLDDADGNKLNRTDREINKKYEKNKKYVYNSSSLEFKDGMSAEMMTKADWRGLINDYRTTTNTDKKQAIAKFVKEEYNRIPYTYKKGDLGQGLLIIKNNYIQP